jgi:hypothetical protein
MLKITTVADDFQQSSIFSVIMSIGAGVDNTSPVLKWILVPASGFIGLIKDTLVM